MRSRKGGTPAEPASKAIAIEPEVGHLATGASDPKLQMRLIQQVIGTLWLPQQLSEKKKRDRVGAALAMLVGIRPQDEIEGLLAVQMTATHDAAVECLRRAALEGQPFEGRDQNLKHATKLLAVFAQQVTALNKHRGKGQQKVTVEYVNVHPGGQAIVGNVERGQAGVRANSRPQPQSALTHNPGETIDLVPGKETVPIRRHEQ